MIKTEMDIKLYYDIDELVGFTHGYYDEFVYEEILFVIKFALGTAEYEEIDQHIYDIVYELGIVEGKIEDLELVNLIKLEEEKALNEPDWLRAVTVLMEVKEFLKNRK